MINRRGFLAAIGLSSTCGSASAGIIDWYNGISVGSTLPKHDIQYFNSLPSADARLRLIDFWATWCGPCREHIPRINAWHDSYVLDGLAIVGLTKEKLEVALPFMAKVPMNYSVGASKLQDLLGVKALPYAIFVDKAETIIWRGVPGSIDEALIESLLKKAA